ncbi:MAG: hypothetical protein AAGA15_03215 [Pseudomonadota bacterium]
MNEPDEVIAVLSAAPGRRAFAVGSMGVLGVLLVLLGFAMSHAPVSAIAFVLIGAVVLGMSWQQYRVTETTLELTEAELRTTDGVTLARVDDITGIDRGVLAFKPSQGFLVHTRSPQTRAWAPGLYWRFGRLLGVGGVTNAAQGKFMAEMIQARISRAES